MYMYTFLTYYLATLRPTQMIDKSRQSITRNNSMRYFLYQVDETAHKLFAVKPGSAVP